VYVVKHFQPTTVSEFWDTDGGQNPWQLKS